MRSMELVAVCCCGSQLRPTRQRALLLCCRLRERFIVDFHVVLNLSYGDREGLSGIGGLKLVRNLDSVHVAKIGEFDRLLDVASQLRHVDRGHSSQEREVLGVDEMFYC